MGSYPSIPPYIMHFKHNNSTLIEKDRIFYWETVNDKGFTKYPVTVERHSINYRKENATIVYYTQGNFSNTHIPVYETVYYLISWYWWIQTFPCYSSS